MTCASCWLWTLAGAVIAFNLLLWLERLYRSGKVDPKGKVVLVTGCDSGFGRSLTERLHGLGFTVVAACLTPAGTAELTTLFGSSGGCLFSCVCVRACMRSVRSCVDFALTRKLGPCQ
jgi:NAD(P)-dependent dehydrogenase (short-subunit alcohol dehydrogenase family)